MPSKSPSKQEEAAFMADLLSGLDDSFWNAVPTPDPSPIKQRNALKSPLKPAMSPLRMRTPKYTKENHDLTGLLDGAEDWDWDDMLSEQGSPRKSPVKKAKVEDTGSIPAYMPDKCTRCVVKTINILPHEKRLTVQIQRSEDHATVILTDDWVTSDIRIGDIVNIIGNFTVAATSTSSVTRTISITAKSNLLILHPDLLLTATALSSAPLCRRKPLLSGLVRSSSDTTPALVWGHLLHEVMQACLVERKWDPAWVEKKVDEVLVKSLNSLVRINITIAEAKRELGERAKGLLAFADRYLADTPKPHAYLSDTRSVRNQNSSLLAIPELLDVEEDIWSPTYGLKGKLDATVDTVISGPDPQNPTRNVISRGPKPFEIKTGRAIAAMDHRAQTMLYTLLAAERYQTQVEDGLLYYTQSEEVVRVPRGRNEIRGLIIARNEMACYMMRRYEYSVRRLKDASEHAPSEPFLPPTIDDERVCKRCYALDTCMLYRKAVEGVVDTSSPIADIYDLKTGHLTPTQLTFFKQWESLISLEEQDLVRFKKELWTMGASERESKGRCFASMVLDTSFRPKPTSTAENKIHSYTYQFQRSPSYHGTSTTSLLNGHINAGDAITVSVEPDLLALARGFVVDLTPTSVVVGVDHMIDLDTIRNRLINAGPIRPSQSQVIFRLDKDELFGGMGRIRDNLAQMFYVGGDARRLELVVDLRKPCFSEMSEPSTPVYMEELSRLNVNQKQAVNKVLTAQDYSLVLGMPGTGKTTVIATIIRILVAMGKSVLLTSYTHSAVDTTLAKLSDANFGILRLGNIDKIHPDVHKFALQASKQATTLEELEDQLMTPPVVATTCLSVDHALFERRRFDYCIVDEASQITLPTCLGPLRFADVFVLVGDHFQLPPLVRHPAARKGGLDVSLFRRLSDRHPEAVVDLAYQYRMNADIMTLSNVLIYGNRLRCGTEEVAQRSLRLPNKTYLDAIHDGATCFSDSCWIKSILAESCRAVFVDTDELPAHDSRVGDLVQNEIEAQLVYQMVTSLLNCGIRQEQVGIISLYKQQVKLLSHLLQDKREIEILTADRSQGRDKDCIIISMVRSNEAGNTGDLVKDWRRMNVSFTRARSKFVLIGSRKTLQKAPVLSEFFRLMDDRGWVLPLPKRAHMLHPCISKLPATPSKRNIASCHIQALDDPSAERPVKKIKSHSPPLAMINRRPILKDLVNGSS